MNPMNLPAAEGARQPPKLLDQAAAKMRVLPYSKRTERAYLDWFVSNCNEALTGGRMPNKPIWTILRILAKMPAHFCLPTMDARLLRSRRPLPRWKREKLPFVRQGGQ